MWYTRCWAMLVMTFPLWAGRWWWGASPLYILRSPPLKGELRIRGGGPIPPAGRPKNPLLTAAFRRLSSRHHLVAVGRAWTALVQCSIQLWRVCASVVKSLFPRREEFVPQRWGTNTSDVVIHDAIPAHHVVHESFIAPYCTLLHAIVADCTNSLGRMSYLCRVISD